MKKIPESSYEEWEFLKNFTQGQVGYEITYWNCGIAECGKIDTI